MNSQNLGSIIKQARLSKKMTQSEVVGSFITRNMLSQIESGAAMPSVKTLEYLCNVLDLQLDSLVGDEVSSGAAAGYVKIRDLFISGNYKEVIDAACPSGFEDEFYALCAKSYVNLAKQLAKSESIAENQTAVEYAKKAQQLSQHGIFSDCVPCDEINTIIKSAAEKLSSYYSSLL